MDVEKKPDGWTPAVDGTFAERRAAWLQALPEALPAKWTPASMPTSTHYQTRYLLMDGSPVLDDLQGFFQIAGETGIASADNRIRLYERFPLRSGRDGTPMTPRQVKKVEGWFSTKLTRKGKVSEKTGLVDLDALFYYFSKVHGDQNGESLYTLDPRGWVAPPPVSEEESELRRHRVLVHHSGRLLSETEMITALIFASFPRRKSGGIRSLRERPRDKANLQKQVMSRVARFRVVEAYDLAGRAAVRHLRAVDTDAADRYERILNERGALPDRFLDIPRPE